MIRAATLVDADALAALTSQLGYPATADDISRRLQRILDRPNQRIFVSCDSDGRPVGWIHVGERTLLEGDDYYEILGLVVHVAQRRKGHARELVAAAEEWAAARGAQHVNVRSNIVRQESHPFYEGLGYTRVKTQHVYRKPLA